MAQTTGDGKSYLESVLKMDRTTSADGTTFDEIHQQLLNNDTFLQSIMQLRNQQATPSGVINYGTITAGLTSTPNAFKFGKDTALINGIPLAITNLGGQSDGSNLVQLDPPPSSNVTPSLPGSARDDLVFLEAWRDATTGAWNTRIRVADGVDFNTYPEGLGATNVYAQGGAASATTKTFTKSSTDSGLYVAGTGSSSDKTTLNTLDGYVYAIPLFRVRRRNSQPYDPDNNPLGGKQYYSLTSTYTPNPSPLSMPGQTATFTANATDIANIQIGDLLTTSGSSFVQVTAKNGNTITVTNINANVATFNTNWYVRSDRPDGLYSNIIDASDIIDLRHQISLTGFNYQALLEQGMNKLLRGQLTTNQTIRYGRDYIGLNLSGYGDDANTLLFCNFDGSINGTANGQPVTGTGSASTYANGVQGTAIVPNATATWSISVPGSQGSIEFLAKLIAIPTSSNYFVVSGVDGSSNTVLKVYLNSTGWNAQFLNGTTVLGTATVNYPNNAVSNWYYVKVTWNGTTLTLQINEVTNTVTLSAAWNGTVNLTTASVNSYVSAIDLLRVSNIVRTGTPLPAGFSYANGDRILDAPYGDFNMWSDDIGGTAGVNGRTNPYGLSRVPNQVAARVSLNGQEIRHYYGQGLTPGWQTGSGIGSAPTGSFDDSAEKPLNGISPNETVDGVRITFTFNLPSNAQGVFAPLYSYLAYVGGVAQTPSSITINGSVVTVTFASAPASGANVSIIPIYAQRHAHFIPSTKGFVIHDWTDDILTADGTKTLFQTSKYNVTYVSQVRVNGSIQNGGYSVSGLNARTTLTAAANSGATSITVASASNFVANQNIRISDGNGGWVTATIQSISSNTITLTAGLSASVAQNAVVEGAALVTFTTAPASGSTVDIVYESVVTPGKNDYIRICYAHLPYQGLLGTPFAGSGTYRFLYVSENGGFITTLGTGSNSTPNVPGWITDYAAPSTQLPINGYDYQLKHDTITLANNTVTSASQQFVMNEQLYELNQPNTANIYSPQAISAPIQGGIPSVRGYSGSNITENGVTGKSIKVALRDLSSAIPHIAGLSLIAQDTSTGELLLLVATALRTDSTNTMNINGTAGVALDIFKLPGRPLIKGYGGVAA